MSDILPFAVNVVALLSAIAAAAYGYYSLRSLQRRQANIRNATEAFRYFAHNSARSDNELFELIFQIVGDANRDDLESKLEVVVQHAQRDIVDALDLAVSAISEVVESRVSGSVKIVTPIGSSSEMSVITLARDRGSEIKREVLEYRYPVRDNLPFSRLLAQEERVYINNDVRSSTEGGYFSNSRRGWTELYKSALIVPLTRDRSSEDEGGARKDIIGFLSFDSERAGAFNEAATRIAQVFAERISVFLYRISAIVDLRARQRGSRPSGSGQQTFASNNLSADG